MPLKSINPATGETIAEHREFSGAEATAIVDAVHAAFIRWRDLSFSERGKHFVQLATLFQTRKNDLAALMTVEMGKPIRSSKTEIEKCAGACEHFAAHAEEYLKPELVQTDAAKSYVAYRPLGAMLAIMPWNFPFWQVIRFAAPAIMAGNTAVLKHASNVTGVSIALEELFRDAGFPKDVFRSLHIGTDSIELIIRHPKIVSVSLTGSSRAGKSVAATAGAALKRCILELGGSDPFIVLEDANLDTAIDAGSIGRLQANGQSCIAAKRFIVVQSRASEFEQALRERFEVVRMGDPTLENTDLGPLARADLRDTLHKQVERSIAKGARLVCGGSVPPGSGAFYPATILADVGPGMPAYEEEIFGPVAALITVKDEEEAICVANATGFGLGAVVCSEDRGRAEAIARDRLEAGSCFVNAFTRSDARLPFGGIKESGFGRELGAHGIRDLCNVKTVYVA